MSRELNPSEFVDMIRGLALADENEAVRLNDELWDELTTKELLNAARNLKIIFGGVL